jgi:antirestriction protein ArdC
MSNAIRKQVTEQIVAALENNLVPWRRPWRSPKNAGRPTSVSTGRPYSGVNPLLCEMHALTHGLQSQWYGTFKQWELLGGRIKQRPSHVKPGEWGCRIVLYKPVSKQVVDEAGKEDKKRFFILKSFTVFNIDQVEAPHLDRFRAKAESSELEFPKFDQAEELIQKTGVSVRFGGDKAFYSLPTPIGSWPNHVGGDYIVMPSREQFECPTSFYETALHELAHWAEVRTDWDREKHGYEMGELVAEMASCFLAAELGIPTTDLGNHAAYLANWLEAMRGDHSYIFKASTQASKTVDYLLSFLRPAEKVEEVEPAEQVA